jgi:magnesium transporter
LSRKSKRKRNAIHRRTPPGASPGLVAPDPAYGKPVVNVIAYGPDRVVEQTIVDLKKIPEFLSSHAVTWVDVEGLGDAATIETLGEMFHIHRLALEDVVNVHQRSKAEDYGDLLFIVVRMASCPERVSTEQLNLFLGKNFVITFQEGHPGDSFDRVRQRIRDGGGRMRVWGADYLAYALIDAAIDAYYPVLEVYAERLDVIEEKVLAAHDRSVMDSLHEVKSDLLTLRRAIWPLRESIAQISREGGTLFTDATKVYLRDCHDHVVQIVELMENYRELTADLRDLYMSAISNRTNEIMRVLTIIATTFIPLTFIVGLYGMNFDYKGGDAPLNMPELHWKYGYPVCIAVMAVTTLAMLGYFYRQGWILPTLRYRSPPAGDAGQ